MKQCDSCAGTESSALKDIARFPLDLGPFFERWSAEGTLRPRLLSALALAHEKNTGCVIRLHSETNKRMAKFLEGLIPFEPDPRRKK